MKKAALLLITILIPVILISCNRQSNEIIYDITEKTAETIVTVLTTEKKDITVEIKQNSAPDELYIPLSSEDSKKVLEIINKYELEIVEAGSDCLFDFTFRIDGIEYAYHYDCGSFENVASGVCSEFKLSEEDIDIFNKIIFEYVPHSNVCQTIVNFTEPETVKEIKKYNTEKSNLSFTLKKTTYGANEFALKMLREAINQQSNALISPVSLISALTMTANGAKNQTLEEMEKVLGADINQLNNDFSISAINTVGVKSANSMWIRKTPSLNVNKNFIDINKKYFGAEIYREDFNGSTLRKINKWIDDNTDGMIKNGLDELPADAVMYIINTVLFDAEWKTKYEPYQIMENDDFTAENGNLQKVSMLCGSMEGNDYNYISIGKTEGMIMDYTNGYSFAALLPDEGTSISEALNSFSGNELADKLVRRSNEDKNETGDFILYTKIPKFSFDCKFSFRNTLSKLGMSLAFDPTKADFSGISNVAGNPLYISDVIHNTGISLTENGTKAGAATVVEIKCGSAMITRETKNLYFNRPFIYMIYQTETGIPLFMGTVRDFNS